MGKIRLQNANTQDIYLCEFQVDVYIAAVEQSHHFSAFWCLSKYEHKITLSPHILINSRYYYL